jgi:YhcN/YlaJ family sporulation lipoprotein
MIVWKKAVGILLAVAMCAALTACMSNGRDNVRPQVTSQTNFLPESTQNANPTAQSAQTTQAPVAFDWVTGSGQIEANVSRLSEIDDCRVVVAGNTALVGVEFEDEYKGEVTERIREMVAAEVKKADPNIQTVAVTAEDDDVNGVYDISDRLRKGEDAETLENRISEIVRNATTLR